MIGFQRNITFSIGKAADRSIVVTATMVDRFHDLAVQTTMDPESLAIKAIRADFARAPTGNCRKTQSRLDQLVGFPVGKGLNRTISNKRKIHHKWLTVDWFPIKCFAVSFKRISLPGGIQFPVKPFQNFFQFPLHQLYFTSSAIETSW